MEYFKTKGGNIFYGNGLEVDKIYWEIVSTDERIYDELFYVEITKEEFVSAYEQVIKKFNEKVYGSKQEAIHG